MKSIKINNLDWYLYLTVVFDDKQGKKYHYISTDVSVKIGDQVTVETENETKICTVVDMGMYREKDVPFPLNKTKTIIAKVIYNNETILNESSEYESREFYDASLAKKILPYCVIEDGILKKIRPCDFETIVIPNCVHTIEAISTFYEYIGRDEDEYLNWVEQSDDSYNNELLKKLIIPSSVKKVMNAVGRGFYKNLEYIYISDGVEEIYSIFESNSIRKLFFPKSLKKMSIDSFDWEKIEKVYLDSRNPYFELENNMLFSKDNSKLYWIKPFTKTLKITKKFELIKEVSRISEYKEIDEIVVEEGLESLPLPYQVFRYIKANKLFLPKSFKEASNFQNFKKIILHPDNKNFIFKDGYLISPGLYHCSKKVVSWISPHIGRNILFVNDLSDAEKYCQERKKLVEEFDVYPGLQIDTLTFGSNVREFKKITELLQGHFNNGIRLIFLKNKHFKEFNRQIFKEEYLGFRGSTISNTKLIELIVDFEEVRFKISDQISDQNKYLEKIIFTKNVTKIKGDINAPRGLEEFSVLNAELSNFDLSSLKDTVWFKKLPEDIIYICRTAWFYKGDKSNLRKIVIREGTIRLSSFLFKDFEFLEEVVLSESLEYIGDEVFCNCIRLKRIIFPENSNLIIGKNSFKNCPNLLDCNGFNIVGEILVDCSNMKIVKIPNNVGIISENCFWRIIQ